MQATVKNAEQLKKCEDVCVSGLRAPREISLLALILNARLREIRRDRNRREGTLGGESSASEKRGRNERVDCERD